MWTYGLHHGVRSPLALLDLVQLRVIVLKLSVMRGTCMV